MPLLPEKKGIMARIQERYRRFKPVLAYSLYSPLYKGEIPNPESLEKVILQPQEGQAVTVLLPIINLKKGAEIFFLDRKGKPVAGIRLEQWADGDKVGKLAILNPLEISEGTTLVPSQRILVAWDGADRKELRRRRDELRADEVLLLPAGPDLSVDQAEGITPILEMDQAGQVFLELPAGTPGGQFSVLVNNGASFLKR